MDAEARRDLSERGLPPWNEILEPAMARADHAMKARGRLKNEVFGQAILPAATIVQIQRLALPDFMVEIRVIARV